MKKTKGTKKCVVKKMLRFEDYKSVYSVMEKC